MRQDKQCVQDCEAWLCTFVFKGPTFRPSGSL